MIRGELTKYNEPSDLNAKVKVYMSASNQVSDRTWSNTPFKITKQGQKNVPSAMFEQDRHVLWWRIKKSWRKTWWKHVFFALLCFSMLQFLYVLFLYFQLDWVVSCSLPPSQFFRMSAKPCRAMLAPKPGLIRRTSSQASSKVQDVGDGSRMAQDIRMGERWHLLPCC